MKIISNTLFVGIDISSQTIAVYFMDQNGKGQKNSIELNNDLIDATLLVEHILTYADTIKADGVKIGVESNLQRFQIQDILPYKDSRDTAFSWFRA